MASRTPFEGRPTPEQNALTLACLPHPTPVLRFPHQVVRKAGLPELEPFDREPFGGIVGWVRRRRKRQWVGDDSLREIAR